MIRGLWNLQVDAVIDVKIVDDYSDTYKHKPMTKLLARWENINEDKDGKQCKNQRKHFSPFFSVSGPVYMEGIPSCDFSTDFSHGREKLRTLFASTGVVKRTHRYQLCEVLLTDDLRSSAPHSPVVTGNGLGSEIRG